MFGFYVLQRLADLPVDVALGHVLVRIRDVVDINIYYRVVCHYGNPGSIMTDYEMMQNVLSRHTKHLYNWNFDVLTTVSVNMAQSRRVAT